jgi:pyruvyltransferase
MIGDKNNASRDLDFAKPVVLNYWAGHNNLGDELSPYMVQKITGRKVVYADSREQNKLVGLGSILNYANAFSSSYIWGSGLLTRKSIKNRLIPIRKFFCKSRVFAVRGPLTASVLDSHGLQSPGIFGDPALLLPMFYTPRAARTSKRLGIICHQQHVKIAREDLLENSDFKLISIFRSGSDDIESFIDELTSCDHIYSTSLHGIVVAHAYGIPAQWISFKGVPIHSDEDFKFNDYFLGANQEVQGKLTIDSLDQESIRFMQSNKVVPARNFAGRNKLLDAFPYRYV